MTAPPVLPAVKPRATDCMVINPPPPIWPGWLGGYPWNGGKKGGPGHPSPKFLQKLSVAKKQQCLLLCGNYLKLSWIG